MFQPVSLGPENTRTLFERHVREPDGVRPMFTCRSAHSPGLRTPSDVFVEPSASDHCLYHSIIGRSALSAASSSITLPKKPILIEVAGSENSSERKRVSVRSTTLALNSVLKPTHPVTRGSRNGRRQAVNVILCLRGISFYMYLA
ncbi:hypothetical protein EVAR_82655_1 [Eumeta japonica]|uniref:Uncharacterized protein n=1 Tax=Eumeta variegata TaxID=151549 RepID=A0A4C1VAC2_EUMVA|nr:hypothetical protein EVAR_82655_1 [Eumeta japonica]